MLCVRRINTSCFIFIVQSVAMTRNIWVITAALTVVMMTQLLLIWFAFARRRKRALAADLVLLFGAEKHLGLL